MFVRLSDVKTVKMKLEVAIMRTYCETEIIIERYNRTFVLLSEYGLRKTYKWLVLSDTSDKFRNLHTSKTTLYVFVDV